MLTLRPYQQEAVDSVFAWFEGDGHDANPLIVLPTATGKSLVLSEICRRSVREYGDMKILVVTHVKELIQQNYEELIGLWPSAPAGIYSAGVGRREYKMPITFCGIQSVHKKSHLFQKVDFVIIDEAHLLGRNDETMYRKFLKALKQANPYMRIIGLTATPYRMDSGMLHTGDNALFDDICYEYSVLDGIKQGYLCPLVTKKTDVALDTSGVHKRGGEFIAGELEAAVDLEEINEAAVKEMLIWGKDRKSWLVFGSGVTHCKHLAEKLEQHGISCAKIFGDTPKDERAKIIADFKAARIRALCSMNVLTVGFNAPNVDMMAILRPTQSVGLFVQMMGRAMRLHPSKNNALILDFAENILRHGPVDMVRVKKGPYKERTEESEGPLTKSCPECKSIVHLACMQCPDCGYEFPREIKIQPTATDLPAISSGPVAHELKVTSMRYSLHKKEGKPDMMRVVYNCGFQNYSEYCCFNHEGFARSKARAWWLKRGDAPAPDTTAEALARTHELKEPVTITVMRKGQFDEITGHTFPVSHLQAGGAGVSTRPQPIDLSDEIPF